MSNANDARSEPRAQSALGHAVVIGGSIAGLLAARVLSDHFAQVTVLEQDVLPEGPTARRGVPQANHVHSLLSRGRGLLEQLFPGLLEDLTAHGAINYDFSADLHIELLGSRLPRFQSGLRSVSCSRALLEWRVRQRLLESPAVKVLEGARAVRLRRDTRGRVDGVEARLSRDSEDATTRVLSADLVVDASGRGSQAPRWLEEMGLGPVPETAVRPAAGYSTRWYRAPRDLLADQLGDWVVIGQSTVFPDAPLGGGIARVEDGQMLVMLTGTGGRYPAGDEQGFQDHVRLLPPHFHKLLEAAEPLSPIHKFRGGVNLRRHFEKVKGFPEGFVVLGDAVCCFNPIYGQGMTVAAMSAMLLGEQVGRRQRAGGRWCSDFQKQLARLHQTPWLLATGEDRRWEKLDEPQGVLDRVNGWTQQRLLSALTATEEGSLLLLQVMHMERPVLALLGARSLAAVVRGARLRMLGDSPR